MSGIVRGWADSMDDLREILYTKQMHDEDIPVAVVPLDDATLLDAAGRMTESYFCREHLPTHLQDGAVSCRACCFNMLRAALGLEGGA